MRRLYALLLALVCACSLHAATPSEKQLENYLRLAREAVARIPAPSADTPSSALIERYSFMIEKLAQESSRAELESVRAVVVQLSARAPGDKKLWRAGEVLLNTLAAEREATLSRYRAEVEKLLKKSARACLAATRPSDLDAILLELAPYRNPAEEPRRRMQLDYSAQQRAIQMFQFVSRWQDYLAARAADDADRARAFLSELRSSVDPALIPRSKLYELNGTTSSPAAKLPAAVTPAPSAPQSELLFARLEKLENLEQLSALSPDLERARAAGVLPEQISQTLTSLLAGRSAAAAGKINLSIFEMENRTPSDSIISPRLAATLTRLTAELRRIALTAVFRDSGLPPDTDEPTDVYVLRVARAAVAAENWEYVLRTLEFHRAVFADRIPPDWNRRELEACLAYVAARRLAEAGQFTQAILAYQDSLAQAATLVPVELVAARLAAIRETNPDAFAEAARYVRPPDRFNRFNYHPSMMQRPQGMQPGYLLPRSERPFTR
jgi:hypothetical protein